MPACLQIHKGSLSLFPGVQRVGLRQPQAPPPEAPGPATAQGKEALEPVSEAFQFSIEFRQQPVCRPQPLQSPLSPGSRQICLLLATFSPAFRIQLSLENQRSASGCLKVTGDNGHKGLGNRHVSG